MNISAPFILRPVGTTLMAIGLFLVGAVAYGFLPVASLPAVDFPTIRISATRPGADPATMAASVAAPIERRLSAISGVTELTSVNSLGQSQITIQFDASRKVDFAARDVQAALNAAATDLPGDLPSLPTFRKVNPAAAPVLILALTSDSLAPSAIYDLADTLIVQRISQLDGVGDVSVSGSEQPAVRVQIDGARVAAMGLSLDAVRAAIVAANAHAAIGSIEGPLQMQTIGVDDQLVSPQDYRKILIPGKNGTFIRLGDVASVGPGVRNVRSSASFNGKPAVILQITKQATANVIETVDRVKALMPELARFLPAGLDISILTDQTRTIRNSVFEVQKTLLISIVLVMLVVFLFMRGATAVFAAGITVPLTLAGTMAAMWLVGFTIDNLSLMAITISVGFVVDDAIVMMENIHRNLEKGLKPLQAALAGARQIGFTIVSISLSLIAAFLPLMFADGLAGKILREFSLTLAFAVLVSTFVSLTVTPMVCGRFMRLEQGASGWMARTVDAGLAALIRGYRKTLWPVLHHPWLAGLATVAAVVLTVALIVQSPKSLFSQDDSGLIFGTTEAAADVSYPAMLDLQGKAVEIVRADPAVASVASFIGSSGPLAGSINQGRLFIGVDPQALKTTKSADIINRLRPKLAALVGIQVYLTPSLSIRTGARSGKSLYQFTLWDPDVGELEAAIPQVLAAFRHVPGVVDLSSDRDSGGLQANVVIDRAAAARFGVAVQDIDTALGNAFGQKQISTIYGDRNQYRVIFELPSQRQRSPEDITDIFVPSTSGVQVPLSALAKIERSTTALSINHQGPFPAVTFSYDLAPGFNLNDVSAAMAKAVADLHLPDGLHADLAGDALASAQGSGSTGLLIVTALLAVYIILGILYESLLHPITILSTLPSAGLGALIALRVAGMDLSLVAMIGIIMLIGIVKKNGIMLVDFAIVAERERGLAPDEAIFEACLERFRPILMTTMAALLGAVPLAVSTGAGSALRQPLGVTIVGGLVLSQLLTLYTTPIIYLGLANLSRWNRRRKSLRRQGPALAAGSGP